MLSTVRRAARSPSGCFWTHCGASTRAGHGWLVTDSTCPAVFEAGYISGSVPLPAVGSALLTTNSTTPTGAHIGKRCINNGFQRTCYDREIEPLPFAFKFRDRQYATGREVT